MGKTRPKKPEREKVPFASADVNGGRVEELKRLFPEAFAEGRVDFGKLREALGEAVDDRPDRYSFTWAGKAQAIRAALAPSRATLKPARGESVDWDTTKNLFIEGDNLEVLKLLYKSDFGRVKMIYIDPPYNTGGDFVYPDNYADPLDTYLKLTGQKDAEGNLLTSNPETSGRYHSAWLSMMYPRLLIARQMLREDGVIFVSIDDNEVHNLRMLMNEIFGEENFVGQIVWKKVYGGGSKAKYIVGLHEYVLCYARQLEVIPNIDLPPDQEARRYYTEKDEKFASRGPYRTQPLGTTSMDERPNLRFPIIWEGEEIWPEKQWQWSQERVEKALKNNELVISKTSGKWSVRYKQYLYSEEGEERAAKLYSIQQGPYTQKGTGEVKELLGGGKIFTFPKPSELIRQFVKLTWRHEDAIIMDFFSGSGVTADAVLQENMADDSSRSFVMVQLPEPCEKQSEAHKAGFGTIADIGKERIRRVIARIKEERAAEAKEAEKDLFKDGEGRAEPDLGFRVFKLDESTRREWPGEAAEAEEEAAAVADAAAAYQRTLEERLDPIHEGVPPEDVLWEVAVREGYALSSTVTEEAFGAKKLYVVSDTGRGQSFRLCLEDKLTLADAKRLDLAKDDLFVCRDCAITDDVASNLALQCRLKTV